MSGTHVIYFPHTPYLYLANFLGSNRYLTSFPKLIGHHISYLPSAQFDSMVLDSENIVPTEVSTSTTLKSRGFGQRSGLHDLQKSSRPQGSISRSKPLGQKRRALGDITNKRKENAQHSVKESQKSGIKTPQKSRNRWTELSHVRRIPTNIDGNVSSPEIIVPPMPLPFEPPRFEFVDSPERQPKCTFDVFDDLKSPESPLRTCPKPPQNFSEFEFKCSPLQNNKAFSVAREKVSQLFMDKEYELELF